MKRTSKSLIVYTSLVFVLSWPIGLYVFGWFDSAGTLVYRYYGSGLMMLMPAIGALIVGRHQGPGSFDGAGWQKAGWPWYAGALVVTFTMFVMPNLLLNVFQNGSIEHPTAKKWLFVGQMAVFGLVSGFGEEFGWRGFMMPRLMNNNRSRATIAVVIVGIVWGVWHWPVALGPFVRELLTVGVDKGELPMELRRVGVECLRLSAGSFALAFIFGFLWLRTGSVLFVSFVHGFHNTMRDASGLLLEETTVGLIVVAGVYLAFYAYAFVWIVRYEKREKMQAVCCRR
jgi:membrane protease YdiL (CAAX protease family)